MQVLDSLVEGMLLLPDEADRQSYSCAVLTYLATGEVPGNLTPVANAMLVANRPVLDNSRARAKAGAAGGRKSPRRGQREGGDEPKSAEDAAAEQAGQADQEQTDKQTPSKPQANAKQTPIKTASEEEEEEEEEGKPYGLPKGGGFSNENPCRAGARPSPPDSVKTQVEEVVAYLNERAGKAFRPDGKHTVSLLRARFREGFTVDDCKAVIERQCSEWLGQVTSEGKSMSDYLRPSTLFSDSKFEGYLNAARSATPRAPADELADVEARIAELRDGLGGDGARPSGSVVGRAEFELMRLEERRRALVDGGAARRR